MKKNSTNWHDIPSMLPKFLLAINNSVCRNTDCTQQFLCTGKESNTQSLYNTVEVQIDMKQKYKYTFAVETERLNLVRTLKNAFAAPLHSQNKYIQAPKYKINNLVHTTVEKRNFCKARPKVGDYV